MICRQKKSRIVVERRVVAGENRVVRMESVALKKDVRRRRAIERRYVEELAERRRRRRRNDERRSIGKLGANRFNQRAAVFARFARVDLLATFRRLAEQLDLHAVGIAVDDELKQSDDDDKRARFASLTCRAAAANVWRPVVLAKSALHCSNGASAPIDSTRRGLWSAGQRAYSASASRVCDVLMRVPLVCKRRVSAAFTRSLARSLATLKPNDESTRCEHQVESSCVIFMRCFSGR